MQRSMRFRYDVIVIGLGRVGLPLSLYLEKLNFKTLGLDKNIELINKLKNKKMPFVENGCDKLIKNSKINFTSIIKIYQVNITIRSQKNKYKDFQL